MSDDIVFKFVSLRAPVANENHLDTIEAGESASDFILSFMQNEDLELENRLQQTVSELVNREKYVINQKNWADLYKSRLSKIILHGKNFETYDDFQIFTSSELNQLGIDIDDSKILADLWCGYLISLFLDGDHGFVIQFFHEWLHILHLVQITQHSPLLPIKRLEIPTELACAFSEIDRNKPIQPDDQENGNPADDFGATNYSRLTHLSNQLLNVEIRNRERAVKVGGNIGSNTTHIAHPLNVGLFTRLLNIFSRPKIKVELSTSDSKPMPIVNNFDDQDVDDESQKTMKEFNLSSSDGIEKTNQKIEQLKLEIYNSAVNNSQMSTISFINGTFVRHFSTATFNQGS